MDSVSEDLIPHPGILDFIEFYPLILGLTNFTPLLLLCISKLHRCLFFHGNVRVLRAESITSYSYLGCSQKVDIFRRWVTKLQ